MAKRIQLHTFHLLFRLFSYLADKSGGWSMFVRPKLVIGSLIVGIGITGCDTKTKNNHLKKHDNQVSKSSNNNTIDQDSVKLNTPISKEINNKKQFVEPIISCYDIELPEDSIDSSRANLKSNMEDTTVSCYVIVPNNTPVDENTPFMFVQQMPEFPNGEKGMQDFIEKHLIYPKEAMKDRKTGVVFCTFVVNKDGSLSKIEVVHGIHPLLDAEAIRIIKSFPKWKPGKEGGKAVPVKFSLPIRFTLPEKKN